MTSSNSKRESDLSSVPYSPLPAQNVIVLVPCPRRPIRRRLLTRCLYGGATLLLVSLAVFLLYPSDPAVKFARARLNHVHVHTSPNLTLDLSFDITIKVRNADFFSLDYDSLLVSVGYRGRELGVVTSAGERIKARASSYVDATLDLDGLQVVHDFIYLIEDLAKGLVPFDTLSKVEGRLGLFFFTVPIKTRVSCEVYVNTRNQTIMRQDCSPE